MNKQTSLSGFAVYALLFVLPVILYISVAGHEFMKSWDDSWMVFNRHTTDGLNLQNLFAIFSETNQGQYSPINQLTYTVIYSIFGADPRAFHLASLLWHAINVCLVFAFTKTLLGLRERENMKMVSTAAFLTALLFAVHPVNAEAVCWISASKVPTCAMFGLSGLLCYLHYIKSGGKAWFVFSIVFFVLSFGCKEQAAALPLCFLHFVLSVECRSHTASGFDVADNNRCRPVYLSFKRRILYGCRMVRS